MWLIQCFHSMWILLFKWLAFEWRSDAVRWIVLHSHSTIYLVILDVVLLISPTCKQFMAFPLKWTLTKTYAVEIQSFKQKKLSSFIYHLSIQHRIACNQPLMKAALFSLHWNLRTKEFTVALWINLWIEKKRPEIIFDLAILGIL